MDFDLKNLLYLGSVPIIIALVQVVKQWVTDTRWYSLASIMFGIVVNLLIGVSSGLNWMTSAFMGIVSGLTASGLYSTNSTLQAGAEAKRSKVNGNGKEAAAKPPTTQPPA